MLLNLDVIISEFHVVKSDFLKNYEFDIINVPDAVLVGEYMATIHNDSETDYTFDDDSFKYIADEKSFEFSIDAVYKDDEGKICDLQQLFYTGLGGVPDLPAGSDTELYVFANHTVKDESLTPECYITITDLTDETGE